MTIDFQSDKDIILPNHYNRIIQGFIYNNIDKDLAEFLHNQGYTANNRSFKLFTFSRILKFGKKIGNRLNFGRSIRIIISSPIDEFCQSIASHMLLSENHRIGNNIVKVANINVDSIEIDEDEITCKTLSPIVAYSTLKKLDGSDYTCYFMPAEVDFNRIVTENMIKKYKAFYGEDIDGEVEFISLDRARQNFTYYKDIIIKGASGKFKVVGDKRLLQLGIDAGFGSKNSQGFGLIDVLSTSK